MRSKPRSHVDSADQTNSGWPAQRLTRGPLLDLAHDGGVEADAGVEAEVAPVDRAEPDPAWSRALDGVGHRASARRRPGRSAARWCGRRRWSSRPAARRGPCRSRPTPLATSFTVPSPPRAATTSTPRLAASWAKRVAWPRRFVSTIVDVVAVAEGLLHEHGVAGGHRRGERVDDEQEPQQGLGRRRYHPPGRPARPRSWSAVVTNGARVAWHLAKPVGNNVRMHVVVCVKQIPDPATPGALDPAHQHAEARGQAHPRRVRQLRRRDGAPARRPPPAAARSASSPWRPTARCRACAPPWRWARRRPCSCRDPALRARTPSPRPRCWPRRSSRLGEADL